MVIAFFAVAGLALLVGLSDSDDEYNVEVTQMVDADEGLDLKAVGEVLKKAKDAEEFEKLLNSADSRVNNLDLNADGKVDYIKVTEFGSDKVRGFSLTTELGPGEVQEIATIKIEKLGEQEAEVEYHGSPAIYGRNHYYHSSWSPGFGTGLMLGYLFAPRRHYASPWGWGRYPPHYRSYATIPASSYRGRWRGYSKSYTPSSYSRVGSDLRSPNAGRNARNVKARLKNPTSSQRSFQSRTASRSRRSGGFGRSSSVRRSSWGRSSFSFGGK